MNINVQASDSTRNSSQHITIDVELSVELESTAAHPFSRKASTASLLILTSDNQWVDFRRLKSVFSTIAQFF